MARNYTASPLFHFAPRVRRVRPCKSTLRVAVSLWGQIALLSAQWSRGGFVSPKGW